MRIARRNFPTSVLLRNIALPSIGLLFLLTTSAFGQTANDPWLILKNGETGSINAHTKREDLVRKYGISNVTDQDAEDEDGEKQPLTVVFAQDPQRRIELLWKDSDKKSEPWLVTIRGKASRWHAVHGVSLGTTLPQLEHINGRPFHFALTHDGTDMAEQHISWHGGLLEKDFEGDGRVTLTLAGPPAKSHAHKGPSNFGGESNESEMRERNLYVDSLTWEFSPRAKQ